MISKYVLALSLLALPIGTVVASGATANASVRPHAAVTFTGAIQCNVTGTITLTPPLLLSTKKTTTIRLTATAAKCIGKTKQGGVSITSGAISGSVTAKSLDCASLTSGVPNPKGSIAWKGTGGTVTPTAVTLSKGAASFGASSTTITFTSTQTGSFKGIGKTSAVVHQTESALISECEGNGIAKLVIASGEFT